MRRTTITRLEEHPNLGEVLGVLAQLAHVTDSDLQSLAEAWRNNAVVAEARSKALSPDSPLIVDVLAAFEAVTALFADDLRGEADYVTVEPEVTIIALKAVRDAIAAAYARPTLSRHEYSALSRPWRQVYPVQTAAEPDLGPHSEQVKALLAALPLLAARCHDRKGQDLFDTLVEHAWTTAPDEHGEAIEAAWQAAVLTSRRRVWALVRRSGAEGMGRPCPDCRRPSGGNDEQRVLTLCLDAACALLVADAVPDAVTSTLTTPLSILIPTQRKAS